MSLAALCFSRTRISVVLGLGLAIASCTATKAKSSAEQPIAGGTAPVVPTATRISCPKGTPTFRVKDRLTLEFECPDGAKPVKTQVVSK